MVSSHSSRFYRRGSRSVLVGCPLSLNKLGDCASRESGCRCLLRHFHFTLAAVPFVLCSTFLGICGWLYSVRYSGDSQLVLGTSAPLFLSELALTDQTHNNIVCLVIAKCGKYPTRSEGISGLIRDNLDTTAPRKVDDR